MNLKAPQTFLSEVPHPETECAPDGLIERAIERHHRAVLSFMYWQLGSTEDAHDAAQDTYTRLLRYRQPGQAEVSRTLIMRIASSVVTDRRRYHGAHRTAAHVTLDGLDFEAPAASPEQILSDQEELAAVKDVMMHLPPRCREVFVLSRVSGMTYPQIARELGISVKAVEKHITKALLEIRRKVGGRGR